MDDATPATVADLSAGPLGAGRVAGQIQLGYQPPPKAQRHGRAKGRAGQKGRNASLFGKWEVLVGGGVRYGDCIVKALSRAGREPKIRTGDASGVAS